MVENVSNDELELSADTLVDLHVFRYSHVHIPVRQTPDQADSAGSGIEPQNWIANGIKHRSRIGEHVQRPSVVMDGVSAGVWFREDTLFVAEEVCAIRRAEGLAVRIRKAIERRAAAQGEYRRDRPAAGDMTQHSVLSLVEGWLIHGIDVVHELPVEVLQPVHIVEVEGIVRRVLAGGLDKSASAQRFAESKVLLKCHAMP